MLLKQCSIASRKGVNLHLDLHFVGADKLVGRPCGRIIRAGFIPCIRAGMILRPILITALKQKKRVRVCPF